MNQKNLKDLFVDDEENFYDDEEDQCSESEECNKCSKEESITESETYVFDKFVDSILIAEKKKRVSLDVEESPLRERARRHQERPLGRIKFGELK